MCDVSLILRMTAGSIQQALSPDGKRMWGSRSIKDHVLLLDWNSSAGAIGSTIDTLKLILEKVSATII